MANYTPTFTKPYPSGWVDKPSKTTPVTAAIMNSYDTAIAALEAYLRDNAIDTVSVSVEQFPSDGRQWIGTITVGSDQYRIYMPSLKYENSVSDGIKIGTITLGEQSFDVYAPASSAGGSTVSVVPKTLTGTNIAEITVDGTTYQLYAPTGGSGSGSTVTAESTLTEGTQIGKITIDGVETILYAPTASPITVDSELSATSENAVQNKAIAEEFQKYENGTKVVAKATEANTATTASNAEKVNGHTVGADVPSNAVFTDTVYDDSSVKTSIQNIVNGTTPVAEATKATQDAKGNVIDTTYAKKTEVPQGTVVDDALSSTSTNPVQNKVVKAEFDKLNSNLSDLSYGENRGGKNLLKFNVLSVITSNSITYTPKYDKNGLLLGIHAEGTASSDSYYTLSNQIILQPGMYSFSGGYSGDALLFYEGANGSAEWFRETVKTLTKESTIGCGIYVPKGKTVNYDFKPMIVETSVFDNKYEPYIPSVAMLTEEVSSLKNDLSDLKYEEVAGGKNLATVEIPFVSNNIIFTKKDDSTLIVNGGNYHDGIAISKNFLAKAGITYTAQIITNLQLGMFIWNSDEEKVATPTIHNKEITFSLTKDTNISIAIIDDSNVTFNNTEIKIQLEEGTQATEYEPYIPSVKMLAEEVNQQKNDLSNLKDGTTPAAKAIADEDGNNIKSTYAKKTETLETATEDVNVVLNSDLFDSTYSDITCVRIGKLCVLSFTIRVKNTISSTIDKIVLMSIVGTKYRPKKPDVNRQRQTFQGFAVGNYDENGKQSQSLNNTVRIITSPSDNYTEIITRDKDRINWNGYVQGQIMWVTD